MYLKFLEIKSTWKIEDLLEKKITQEAVRTASHATSALRKADTYNFLIYRLRYTFIICFIINQHYGKRK